MSKDTRKSNGEGSIFQTKDGRWCARIQDGKNKNGSPHIKNFSAKTRKEVVAKLNEYKTLMDNNCSRSINPTLDEYMNSWLLNVKAQTLADTSFSGLFNLCQNHIIGTLGHYRLSELNTAILQQLFINKLFSEGRSYSLIHQSYLALNECLEYAFQQRQIVSNPCKLVVIPNANSIPKKRKECIILSDEEINAFITECLRDNVRHSQRYYFGDWFVFLLFTGLRISELLGLKWDCVDFNNRTIKIKRIVVSIKYNQKKRIYTREMVAHERTKTDKGTRTIPLCDKAYEILIKMQQRDEYMLKQKHTRKDYLNEGYVFLNKNGNIPYEDDLLLRLRTICKGCDLPPMTLHMLRHNFGSILFRNKVDVVTISKLMGHKNPSITINVYIDVINSLSQDNVNYFNQYTKTAN